MSLPERETPEERTNKWNTALTGLFKGYSIATWYPKLIETEIEVKSGERRGFLVFGAFGEEGDQYKPEVLTILSDDAEIRITGRAKWNGDWPEVQDVDIIGGLVTIKGKVQDIREGIISVPESEITEHNVPLDEMLDVVNKLALSLRLSRTDLTEQENI